MKKWIVIILIIGAAAAGAYWTWGGKKTGVQSASTDMSPATALVGLTNIAFAVSAAGDIGPADQVSVRPEINGKIMTLDVDIGDNVKRSAVLFTLDDKDLQSQRSSSQTSVEGAQLQVDKCRRNHERAERLYAEKLISQETYENTKTEYDLAKNSFERAQKELAILEEQLTKTKILAPFDCTVLTRPVSVGQAVSGSGGYNSGTEVLTIANLNAMIVNTHINQADVTRMRTNQEVSMEVEAVPGLKFKGTIERIAPQATVRNGIKGFATRIDLTTIDPRIRPGMTANISIPVAAAANVSAVPLAAVFSDMGDHYVWIVTQNGGAYHYERRPVTVGIADYSMAEIQSGIKPGETVALESPPAKVLEALEKESQDAKPAATNAPKKTALDASGKTSKP